ncbi:MAG: TIGR03773 family transporter-associated surface protein, partial [Bowdeniella nasicola]|nr:TIGR03773 family transporter-associated surface protein [Bowdeniella nasicola]
PTKVTRTVNSAANVAVEGHFDLGAQLVGGQLQSSLKDDRRQPASWVNPSSVVFHLSDAAKTTAPADFGFVAAPGSTVWAIGSVQRPGIPWLGQNTQHPSIVNGTTGPVTWRLVSVKGPGKMAVFNAGSFGSGVGQRVFDNVGGPTSYQIPANTHSHPNWVFTQPGAYHVTIEQTATTKAGAKVSSTTVLHFAVGVDPKTAAAATTVEEWVGKTPSGKDCVLSAEQIAKLPKGAKIGGLNANMPTTGAENQELTLAAVVLLLAGCTILMVRRRFA